MSRPLVGWLALVLLLSVGVTAHALKEGPLRGQLLVASGQLDQTDFEHTVILVLRHGPGGAYGVVINRPTGASLADVLPNEIRSKNQDFAVYAGGPVGADELSVLVRGKFADKRIDQVLPGAAYTANAKAFDKLVGQAPASQDIRVLAGHVRWGPNQLESEIAGGAWSVVHASADKIFSGKPEDIWGQLHGGGTHKPQTSDGAPLHSI